MFKVLAFLKRKPGMSREEFRAYYETRHTALIAELAPPPPGAYRRNFLMIGDAANVGAEDLDFDVVTELEFADRGEYGRWFAALTAPGSRERVEADESNFIDQGKFRVCVVEVEE
jgi:EthD domain-containing protein